ncbi:MAG TPA: glycosyltransferase family 4 protein [Flavitalea sp.]|nr:glycosyltransferase family 4 protein [Flavitalea sp.]
MKVLMVNWTWYPSGGDWTYVENLSALYSKHGYEVIPFSTKNERNFDSPYKKYFIDRYDYKDLNKNKNIKNGFRVIKNSIVSTQALNMLDLILSEHNIDVAHLHNIHNYLTPEIIKKLKSRNVKVLWSLHDYKIICPENSFVSNGKICEKCISGKFYECTINRCKKRSLAASAVASVEAYYYHWSQIYKLVDAYLCPSQFLNNKFIQFGFEPSRLSITNYCYNILNIDNYIANIQLSEAEVTSIIDKSDDYILFVGRIEYIKGIKTLVDAVGGTTVKLLIAGTGNVLDEIQRYSIEMNYFNIGFLGFQNKEKIFDLIYHSKFCVCPSEWYENFPFSIIESLLFSKPVIGARIGGIPELVIDGKSGLLFQPGNAQDLQSKIDLLWNDSNLTDVMGKFGREHVFDLVNYENHWKKINSILNQN